MDLVAPRLLRVAAAAAFLTSAALPCRAQEPAPLSTSLLSTPVNAPVPPLTIDAGEEHIEGAGSLSSSTGAFAITGGVTVVGGSEFTLRADAVTGNMQTGIETASGHVIFRELNTYLYADSLFGSQTLKAGSANNVEIYSYPYTVRAGRLSFQQNAVQLYSASLTTSPPDQKPEYTIRAAQITYLPLSHRIVVRNAAFYLGNKRLFEQRKLTLKTGTAKSGAGTTDNLISTSFGYNSYNGPFIVYRTHDGVPDDGVTASVILPERHTIGGVVTATATLIRPHPGPQAIAPKTLIGRIRAVAEASEPILPVGDPLLFHWFQSITAMNDRFETIPSTLALTVSGTTSYYEPVYGHDTNDLFYSRLPEASFTAVAPISGPRTLSNSRDPAQMREALHQIALYAVLTPTIGRYSEYPDNISTDREAAQLSIESRPILIGNNLLFKPALGYKDSTYPEKKQAFQVFQVDLALEKYFTDRTGFGFEYLNSAERGSSPFQFDTPYAAQEFDTRLQYGLSRVILGAVLKYDLETDNLYSEQVLVAPILGSVIPKFTYDFKDSAFGVGVDIQGLTY